MVETIIFPTVVGHIVTYLAGEMPGEMFVDRSPREGAKRYVRIRRTGGVLTNKIMATVQLTADVYDIDNGAAEQFVEEVRARARTLVGTGQDGFNCTRYLEYGGPQFTWDPNAPALSRFRFTFALYLKGKPTP